MPAAAIPDGKNGRSPDRAFLGSGPETLVASCSAATLVTPALSAALAAPLAGSVLAEQAEEGWEGCARPAPAPCASTPSKEALSWCRCCSCCSCRSCCSMSSSCEGQRPSGNVRHRPQAVCGCASQGGVAAVRQCGGAAVEGSKGAQRACGRMSRPTTASRQPALRSHSSRHRSASRRCAATSDCTSALSSRAASCATCHGPLGMS
eukprot:scaffold53700_cov64-Phaeocystis_antarctica.AAC.2